MSLLGKLKNLVHELGIVGTLCYVAYRLSAKSRGRASLHRYFLVAQPVPTAPLLPARRGRSIAVRQVDPEDPVLLALPLDRAVLSYRARQGAVCFGAFREADIIGCLWLCLSPYEEDEVDCRYCPEPPAATSWDFDVYLKPAHRNGIGFARLWDTANDFLRRRGVAYSWSRISAFNPASLASHARLGAEIVGSATFLKVGRAQVMVTSMPPYVHFCRRRVDMPSIRLSREHRDRAIGTTAHDPPDRSSSGVTPSP